MTVVAELTQDVANACLDTRRIVFLHTQRTGYLVGGQEADAVDVARQAVRFFLQNVERAIAVGLVNSHRERRAYPVALQKHHHLFDLLLLSPTALDDCNSLGPHTLYFLQPLRRFLDDLQGVEPKVLDDTLGGHRADALDQP